MDAKVSNLHSMLTFHSVKCKARGGAAGEYYLHNSPLTLGAQCLSESQPPSNLKLESARFLHMLLPSSSAEEGKPLTSSHCLRFN